MTNNNNNNFFRNILITLAVLITLILSFNELNLINFNTIKQTAQTNQNIVNSRMTYGRFLEYLDLGWVKQVDLYNNSRNAIIKASSPELGNRPQIIKVEIPVGASQLIQKLKESNIDFDAHAVEQTNLFVNLINNLILPTIFVVLLITFLQNYDELTGGSISSPLNIIKSPAKFKRKPNTGVYFDDIAGIDEAKADFEEIVSFLKEPDRYTLVGAKIPKGILLVGPPGTGKTLLAKAIANEADVPFFSISGSEFVEMFIGVGAARVRNLFNKAAENSPCIIFIDEIDAIGRERGAGVGGGNDEREQTLNQLLTEMDGFKENKGVIVVGATNRADILDRALLRPGRFSRQITVGLPDRLGRINILKVHARNKPLADDVSLVQLANRTPGFSGADLANLLNEAGILSARYNKSSITKNEVIEAADRIIGGIAGTTVEDNKNKKVIAYHEVGHAITGSVLISHDEIEKVTIAPRGNAKGLTWFTPDEDQSLVSRSTLLAQIITALGGRAAEQVIFGYTEITTGASNDIQRVTSLARQIVTRFGMSKIGPIALEDATSGEVFLGGNTGQSTEYSKELVNRIDAEVSEIITYCEGKALQIISDNRVIIDLIVEKLLDVETLDGNEFRQLLSQYTILPDKKMPYVSNFN
uniref:ATP-dependent zinc metalloprotease FtsH n=1 Tax=Toxarium undulatum TaxID=210620 RepID=A0A1D8D9U7_9STRA|nr:cell division protein FTSH [Toxarium undulatum]YP_009308959.1 cell division protein FTSH [Toxarium undulatum]AOS86620.1 cell division protein FTSH [Toxarium undulatum]AOS86702.1 cell division protein FTSH [Toxarium undulatum]